MYNVMSQIAISVKTGGRVLHREGSAAGDCYRPFNGKFPAGKRHQSCHFLRLLVLLTVLGFAIEVAACTKIAPPVNSVQSSTPTTSSDAVRSDAFGPTFSIHIVTGADVQLAWALLEVGSGRRTGSGNHVMLRLNAESTIKAWIVADFLRKEGQAGRRPTPGDIETIDAAIRRSDDASAEQLYRRAGGDLVLADLLDVCGVRVSTLYPGYWSYTQVNADDAIDIFSCSIRQAQLWDGGQSFLADLGSVLSPGNRGISEVLRSTTPVRVKNGWTSHAATGRWNVNCVAAWDDYILSVLTSYPVANGVDYGFTLCRKVANQLLQP